MKREKRRDKNKGKKNDRWQKGEGKSRKEEGTGKEVAHPQEHATRKNTIVQRILASTLVECFVKEITR